MVWGNIVIYGIKGDQRCMMGCCWDVVNIVLVSVVAYAEFFAF